MLQCQFALKPDGLFLGAMFGGDTLEELRISCHLTQEEVEGGISPYVSPFIHVRDAGSLLTSAGLALPTVDVDTVRMMYPSPLDVVNHLRAMGESNALVTRAGRVKRTTAEATGRKYREMFGDARGQVPATFQIVYLTGWAPSPTQPQPAARGSAEFSLENLAEELERFKTKEKGDTEGP